MDSVARGTLINLATRTLAVGGVLAVTTVTARLSPQAQGAFALFTSAEGLLLALLSGFGIALARRVSHHREEPRGLMTAIALACVGLGVVAGLVLWIVAWFAPPAYAPLLLLALAAPLLLLAPNLGGWWLGAGRMAPMARLALAPPYLTLALLAAAAVLNSTGLLAVLSCWLAGKVMVALALLAILWRRGRFARPDFAALRSELPFVATIGVTNLISLLNYRVGLFIVERTLGLGATGIYSISVVVAELLWFVSSSLTQATYGRIGTADRGQAAATTVRVVQLGGAALAVAAPLLWLGAWRGLPWLLGPEYAASVLPLALLLPGALLFGAASALSAYYTNHAGQPHVPAQVALLSLAVNAGLALLLVPLWGTAGAALAATAAYTASVLVLAVRFARHAKLPLRAVLVPGRQLGADLRAVFRRGR